MKIGIFQDIHANLPAFTKAIEIFRSKGCSAIYHVGDLIGIGPYPKEVLEMALTVSELKLIMGNHDYWYAYGLPEQMSQEEAEHQRWTHQQLGAQYKSVVQQWKFVEELSLRGGLKIGFLHYGYDSLSNWFKDFVKNRNEQKFDQLFQEMEADLIFYGHDHAPHDAASQTRYVNLGSAGCYDKPEVRIGVLSLKNSAFELEKLSIPYEDNGLMEEFEAREVPARDFIMKTFITRL